jgi:hypothetical protein
MKSLIKICGSCLLLCVTGCGDKSKAYYVFLYTACGGYKLMMMTTRGG